MINFLIKHKAEVGDSKMFKAPIWNAASQLLEKSHIKGGPKKSKACADKWMRVCRTALDNDLQRCEGRLKKETEL